MSTPNGFLKVKTDLRFLLLLPTHSVTLALLLIYILNVKKKRRPSLISGPVWKKKVLHFLIVELDQFSLYIRGSDSQLDYFSSY